MPIVSLDKLLAFIIVIKDRDLGQGEIKLFRCPENQLYWMVTEGSGANQYDLALRVIGEIVSVVIKEDQVVKRLLRAQPIAAVEIQQPAELAGLVGKLRAKVQGEQGVDAEEDMAVDLEERGEEGEEGEEGAAVGPETEEPPVDMEDIEDDGHQAQVEDTAAAARADIVAGAIANMKDEPTLFMDGEGHQLKQIFQLLDHDKFPGSIFKSGGSCSPFQQTLDVMKAFMTIRKFLNGHEFQASLALPDNKKVVNALTRGFGPHLSKIASASRRVFITFLGEIGSLVAKAYTPKSIRKAWGLVGAVEFNQEMILGRCPGWEAAFSQTEKLAIHKRMPLIVQEAASLGYASDESIMKHMGDLIGPPSRGLPNAAPLVGPQPQAAQNMAGAAAAVAVGAALPLIIQPAHVQGPMLAAPRLNPPTKPIPANATPLQLLGIDRWRASFWTKAYLNAAMAFQAAAQNAKEEDKQAKLQKKANKKQVAEDAKRQKDEAKALDLVLGPKQRVVRAKNAALACERCAMVMPLAPPNAADDWQSCDYCEGRWYCPHKDGLCLALLAEHEGVCRVAAAEREREYQLAVAAAPRGPPKTPKRNLVGGRGGGRGKTGRK